MIDAPTPKPVPDITWDGAAHSSPARTVPITSKGDRPLTVNELADDAIGMFIEYRDVHGAPEETARAKAILEVAEGIGYRDDERVERLAARISSLEEEREGLIEQRDGLLRLIEQHLKPEIADLRAFKADYVRSHKCDGCGAGPGFPRHLCSRTECPIRSALAALGDSHE